MNFKKEINRIRALKSFDDSMKAYDELSKKITKEEKFWTRIELGFVLFALLLIIIMVISKIWG